ncbi:hypothetical protein [Pseudaminobacter soli (ex Li et al. 2025)]|uniref:Uncharacterized protein n=1 Tax=Pseudaminobacter soli (ex Li et al. 2025) TaxID=1295366 RepID=A0A2P7RZX7_9HYPH|nr:hypothetical protein [Mesorhizobium soli]PSJ55797.1 hypothetical protein C7I85_26280 [Mesorhizobium soli]
MGLFSTFFSPLKMAFTGTLVSQIDIPVSSGLTLSLRLKRDGYGKHYVVLAGFASGEYQYYRLELSEFADFASAVNAIDASIAANVRPPP